MNRPLLISLLIVFCLNAKAQEVADSTESITAGVPKVNEKFIKTVYLRTMPFCLYTGADYLKDKINQNVEIGKSFGILDVGAALGRNALRRDTAGNGTTYLEAKVTMEIASYGLFSNEMIVGGGYVFDSKNFLMLELSYSIYGQFWKRVGLGIVAGFYDFSGNTTDNSRNTFGLFCRYGMKRPEGGLFNANRPRARTQHRHRSR